MSPDPFGDSAVPPGRLEKAWSGVERGLGIGASLVLLAMMGLTGADVIARYVVNAPIQGAFELTQVFLVLLVYLAMPLATRGGDHVEVELWEPRSRIGNLLRLVLASLCALIVFGGLAYQLFEHGNRLAGYGSVTNALGIPLSYVAWLAAACCVLCVLAVILNLLGRKENV